MIPAKIGSNWHSIYQITLNLLPKVPVMIPLFTFLFTHHSVRSKLLQALDIPRAYLFNYQFLQTFYQYEIIHTQRNAINP